MTKKQKRAWSIVAFIMILIMIPFVAFPLYGIYTRGGEPIQDYVSLTNISVKKKTSRRPSSWGLEATLTATNGNKYTFANPKLYESEFKSLLEYSTDPYQNGSTLALYRRDYKRYTRDFAMDPSDNFEITLQGPNSNRIIGMRDIASERTILRSEKVLADEQFNANLLMIAVPGFMLSILLFSFAPELWPKFFAKYGLKPVKKKKTSKRSKKQD